MPSQKFGVEMPHSANDVGGVVPGGAAPDRGDDARRDADRRARSRIASSASSSVTGSFCSDELEHRLLVAHRLAEVAAQHAADPVGIAHRQRLVEVQLRRADRRRRSGPAPRRRGSSPGRRAAAAAARRSASTRSTSVGTMVARRLTRNSSIARCASRQFIFRPLHAQQAVGDVAQAAELGVVGPQPVAVVEVDDRPVLQHLRGDLLVASSCARPGRAARATG